MKDSIPDTYKDLSITRRDMLAKQAYESVTGKDRRARFWYKRGKSDTVYNGDVPERYKAHYEMGWSSANIRGLKSG